MPHPDAHASGAPGDLTVGSAPGEAALDEAVDRVAGRLRALPQSRLRSGGLAAEALALARLLSRRAQELESPGRVPYELPDDGIFAVGDQLAVAGHDLARAVEADPVNGPRVRAQALELLAGTAASIG